MNVTVTRQVPIEVLSLDGAMSGVKEAPLGTKLTWVKTDAPTSSPGRRPARRYRIPASATDYVPASATTPAPVAATTPAPAVASAVSSPSPAAAPDASTGGQRHRARFRP
ncbi:MAG: hypothetical protein WDO13_13930 [Verrucomicrobiota bacterium]